MGDQSVNKVSSQYSPRGEMGQKYLAAGIHISMRLWESLTPAPPTSLTQRDYETVGYVIRGRANLKIEGQILYRSRQAIRGSSPRVRVIVTKFSSHLLRWKPPLLQPRFMAGTNETERAKPENFTLTSDHRKVSKFIAV